MLNKKAFTLVELMIVVFIVSMGMVGVMSLISQIFLYTHLNQSKLTGAYLAQEGIEIVRNIRDTNWLEGRTDNGTVTPGDETDDWDYKIKGSGTDYTYAVQYDTNSASIDYSPNSIDDPGARLKINGFYSHGAVNPTFFYRLITVEKISNDKLRVRCEVKWTEHAHSYQIVAEEHLYKWR